MRWLGRRPLPPGPHRTAMFTGGNVGMVLGMAAGGTAASGVLGHFLGMTVGMVAGMLLGTWLAEGLLSVRWTRHRAASEGGPYQSTAVGAALRGGPVADQRAK